MPDTPNDTRPIDPNVKIPASVRALAARADEVHKETYKKDDADTIASQEQTTPTTETKSDTTASATTTDSTSVTPASNAPVVTDKQPDAKPDVVSDWERRYNSMKGRFEQAQDANRQLSDRLSQLEEALAVSQLSKVTTVPENVQPEKLVTPQEEETFGAEFLDVVSKKARETLSPEVVALRKQVSNLQAKLDGVVDVTVKRTRVDMKKALADAVPNWLELNHDEKFLSWLGLQDPLSGLNRHSMLKNAWAQNDASRVINFFKGFLSQQAAETPQGNDTDKVPGATQDVTPKVDKVPLETFAAPGRAKTSAADVAPAGEKPLITRAQIGKFYEAVRAGVYRGRDAEKDQLERAIFAAQREGRIR